MRSLTVFASLVAALSVLADRAEAQWFPVETHASTAEEGIANGMANIISSAGAANLMNAQAASQAEEARTKYIQNRLLATQTFFDMRRVNAEYRKETQGRPLSMEQYVRLAQMQAPDRMSPSELDTFTGKIYWPPQLMGKEYAEQREKLEALFAARAKGDLQTFGQIREATNQFLADLRANISNFAPQDYIRSRRFVESLAFESNFVQR